MGFKSDREFLGNVTVGAVGTRKVAGLLRSVGFRIIELERYASRNKIWATKVKRLRVPDLLCVKTGIRIESRAKSILKVTMSHAVSNEQRAWDKGLRDDDLVAFIQCAEVESGVWEPSSHVSLFRVADMRATVEAAGLSRMKAASEGSEIQLTWPAVVPRQDGTVAGVDDTSIATELVTGRKQKYRLLSKYGVQRPYVKVGDEFLGGAQIIASVMTALVPLECPLTSQYDFVADLDSDDRATVYAAAKALGFLPELAEQSVPAIRRTFEYRDDPLLRLECAGALARLNVADGWRAIEEAIDHGEDASVCMEAALILSEFRVDESVEILSKVSMNTDFRRAVSVIRV